MGDKDKLEELARLSRSPVRFEMISQKGPDHAPEFEMMCIVGQIEFTGKGSNKKAAKATAVEKAVDFYKLVGKKEVQTEKAAASTSKPIPHYVNKTSKASTSASKNDDFCPPCPGGTNVKHAPSWSPSQRIDNYSGPYPLHQLESARQTLIRGITNAPVALQVIMPSIGIGSNSLEPNNWTLNASGRGRPCSPPSDIFLLMDQKQPKKTNSFEPNNWTLNDTVSQKSSEKCWSSDQFKDNWYEQSRVNEHALVKGGVAHDSSGTEGQRFTGNRSHRTHNNTRRSHTTTNTFVPNQQHYQPITVPTLPNMGYGLQGAAPAGYQAYGGYNTGYINNLQQQQQQYANFNGSIIQQLMQLGAQVQAVNQNFY